MFKSDGDEVACALLWDHCPALKKYMYVHGTHSLVPRSASKGEMRAIEEGPIIHKTDKRTQVSCRPAQIAYRILKHRHEFLKTS